MEKEELEKEITKLFKKYFVRRPNGNCQVLFALTELDSLVDDICLVDRTKHKNKDTIPEILSILKELEMGRKTRANPMDYPKDSPAELNALANSGFNLAVTELNSKIEEIRGRYE